MGLCIAAGLAVPAAVAAELTFAEAQARVAGALKGNTPYGATEDDVIRHIHRGELQRTGRTHCGPVTRPVWVFHIVVPPADNPHGRRIAGMLALDAVSGRVLCTNLPIRN
jgi:hypothetical protein